MSRKTQSIALSRPSWHAVSHTQCTHDESNLHCIVLCCSFALKALTLLEIEDQMVRRVSSSLLLSKPEATYCMLRLRCSDSELFVRTITHVKVMVLSNVLLTWFCVLRSLQRATVDEDFPSNTHPGTNNGHNMTNATTSLPSLPSRLLAPAHKNYTDLSDRSGHQEGVESCFAQVPPRQTRRW
jgi:hypothetical protein